MAKRTKKGLKNNSKALVIALILVIVGFVVVAISNNLSNGNSLTLNSRAYDDGPTPTPPPGGWPILTSTPSPEQLARAKFACISDSGIGMGDPVEGKSPSCYRNFNLICTQSTSYIPTEYRRFCTKELIRTGSFAGRYWVNCRFVANMCVTEDKKYELAAKLCGCFR